MGGGGVAPFCLRDANPVGQILAERGNLKLMSAYSGQERARLAYRQQVRRALRLPRTATKNGVLHVTREVLSFQWYRTNSIVEHYE